MPRRFWGNTVPYESDRQRRFFHAAEARGEISHKTMAEYDKASKGKDLPEKKGKFQKAAEKHGR